MLKVLDLFSGIGGFSLGLERTGGFTTSAFCEICPKARKVLSKHWPNVKQYTDIRELTDERLKQDGFEIDVITGGFPCQDISVAGKGEGILAKRSGLWAEMFRLVRDVRPAWAIIENVSALRSKGLTLVLKNLCEIGYMCEFHCIPASCAAIGAPHQRDRIWIVANPLQQYETQRGEREITESQGGGGGIEQGRSEGDAERQRSLRGTGGDPCDELRVINKTPRADFWAVEPNVGRVAHGVPHRVDRLKQLGNSVVPQIPELIGNAILEII